MDEFGHAGYVAWFGLIEIIAKENGHEITGKLDISPTILRRKLRTTQTKLRQVFDFCSANARLSFDSSGKRWSFHLPKMLDIKDNYTKDLQAPSKKLSHHKEVEEEVEEEVDKSSVKEFDQFWNLYPKRNGKKHGKMDCTRHFKKNVFAYDYDVILTATKHYANSREVKEGFARDPIRFLKKDYWREWIEPEKATKDLSVKERMEQGRGRV